MCTIMYKYPNFKYIGLSAGNLQKVWYLVINLIVLDQAIDETNKLKANCL